jgi:ABC-type sugar transport system permease subunit
VGLSARHQPLTPREAIVLRIVLAALSAAFACVGAIGFLDLVGEPEHSLHNASFGFAAFGVLAAGGATYSLGVALWTGDGFALRASGWTLIVLALALPSQLMLGLPLACTLAVGLQRVHRRQTDGTTNDRAPLTHRRLGRRPL